MNNFKSGSGNLDFGDSSDEEETGEKEERGTTGREESTNTVSENSAPPNDPVSGPQDQQQYPYFVRRSNVTDERDSRIELHLRESVADAEAPFRNELAEALGTDEIAKTDAREFALRFAYENPEQVAELMREEGYGVLDG